MPPSSRAPHSLLRHGVLLVFPSLWWAAWGSTAAQSGRRVCDLVARLGTRARKRKVGASTAEDAYDDGCRHSRLRRILATALLMDSLHDMYFCDIQIASVRDFPAAVVRRHVKLDETSYISDKATRSRKGNLLQYESHLRP
ncbi:hypothetical protein DFH06DRAFT_1299387 [Mycena polygramma]|nr:hypothetical protein DFH06DRAFT_1299387 [Mycena polygramma]